eukprot:476047_1
MAHLIHLLIIIYITLSHGTTTTNHLTTIYNSYYFNLNNASEWIINQPNNSSKQTICTLQIPSLCIQYNTSPPQQHINILYNDISFNFIQPSHDYTNTIKPSKALTIIPTDNTISTRRRLRSCANMLYHRRHRIRPRRGHRIRNINIEDNMIISMDITVKSWPRSTWASIFHCGSRNTIRQPGLWINRHGRYFHVVYGTTGNWNRLKNYRIRLNRKYKIEYKIRRNRYDVYINGRRFHSVSGRHHNHRNQPCYLSDPWYEAANVWVENLKIIRGTNPSGCYRSSGSFEGPYRIRGIGSNRCLDISGYPRNGARLIIWDCHRGANQRWYINKRTREFRVGSKRGKCLDIHGSHYNQRRNGATVHYWKCHGGQNQKFRFVGKWIQSQGKMNGKCLDVWRAQRRRGAKVILWPCHRGSNQQWKLEWIGRGLGCPRGTRTIGKQGHNNDIGGCGIGGCSSRYSERNINACKERCGENKRCKSWTWAPKHGDRSHRNRNVCTIYDRSRANNKWGPNQIMCGAPRRRTDFSRALTGRERRNHGIYYKKMYKLGKDIGKIFKKDKDRRCGKKCDKKKNRRVIPFGFDPFNVGPVHPEYGLSGFIVDKSLEEQVEEQKERAEEAEKEKEKEKEKESKRRLISDMDMRLKKCVLIEE